MPPQTENDAPGLPPLRLRSSVFFYLGVFPIVLLLWAWADSVKNHTNWFRRLENDRSFGLILENSMIRSEVVSHWPDYDGPPMPPLPFYGQSYRFGADNKDAAGKPMPVFPAFVWRTALEDREPSFHVRALMVPLWVILAAYLPLWLGISHGLARRRRQKLLATLPRLPVEQRQGGA